MLIGAKSQLYTRVLVNKINVTRSTFSVVLFFLSRSLSCPVQLGFHQELWTAQSEPSPRCPTLLGQQFTEPPSRRGLLIFGQNMLLMTRMAEEEEGGWSTGTWLLDPQVSSCIMFL